MHGTSRILMIIFLVVEEPFASSILQDHAESPELLGHLMPHGPEGQSKTCPQHVFMPAVRELHIKHQGVTAHRTK